MQYNGEQFKANSGVANLDVECDEMKAAFCQEGKRAWDVYSFVASRSGATHPRVA
jgi:hypothetical protein